MRTYCNPLISPSLISPASEVNKIVGHPPPQPLISPPLPPFFVYFKYFLDRKLTLNILKLLHQEETNQAGGITVLKKHLHGQNNGHIIIIHENCPFVAKCNKPPPPSYSQPPSHRSEICLALEGLFMGFTNLVSPFSACLVYLLTNQKLYVQHVYCCDNSSKFRHNQLGFKDFTKNNYQTFANIKAQFYNFCLKNKIVQNQCIKPLKDS